MLTEDFTDHEPAGGYVVWDGTEHHVSLFETAEGSFAEYDDAVDHLILISRELLAHPHWKNTSIECFFAVNDGKSMLRIPLGTIREKRIGNG